jgi:hypothetical protein
MRDAYRRRPDDFKRRIIKTNILGKKETFIEEQRYLGFIKPEEIKSRYYNLNTNLKHFLTFENEIDIRNKISISLTGKKQSAETVEKRVSKTRGRVHSEETKEKMRNACKKRKPISEETRQKMSISKRSMSEETKQKIREANLGKIRGPMNEEQKIKLRKPKIRKPKIIHLDIL